MASSETRDDAELVRLVLAGETELFAVLVDRYRSRLSRYVERFTYDVEDARDVTQDVFIKVYGALDSFDPHFKFSTWLFRIAGNAAIDHLRRRRVRTLPLERQSAHAPPPQMVDRGVPGDSKEPRRKLEMRVERIEGAIYFDEDVLGNVAGILDVIREALHVPREAGSVAVHEDGEQFGLARENEPHQLRVITGFGRRHDEIVSYQPP